MVEHIDFEKAYIKLRNYGFNIIPDLVQIKIPNAEYNLKSGLNFIFGNHYKWLPEYNEIAKWLENNNGRGLMCCGTCGRGKSVICGMIIPVLINYYSKRIVYIYDTQQMNNNIDIIKSQHLIYIDDIGTESISIKYGEKRMCFPEIVDEAEKKGKLIIFTTNLSIKELKDKYGERTIDRLKAITKVIIFNGKSLRV